MDLICTNEERCGREAGYCETCVEAMVQDERERCAKIAENRPRLSGHALAQAIRQKESE